MPHNLEARLQQLIDEAAAAEQRKQQLERARLEEVQQVARQLAPWLGTAPLNEAGYSLVDISYRFTVLHGLWAWLRYRQLYRLHRDVSPIGDVGSFNYDVLTTKQGELVFVNTYGHHRWKLLPARRGRVLADVHQRVLRQFAELHNL